MNKYKPQIYKKNIFEINYDKLLKMNKFIIFFDVDNTLALVKDKYPNEQTINLVNSLKEKGFTMFIITNALKKRALQFEKALNIKAYYLSWKPNKRQYERIIKDNNLNRENIVAIGDQIYTDIIGANKMNITSILVDSLSPKEAWYTKINRIKENKLIKKTKIIERGNYYE